MRNDFQKIHEDFRAPVLRYLQRLIGDREAEDVTQEVFVRVHAGLDEFRGRSSLSTWIYRIATNTAIDRMRSSSFGKEQSFDAFEEDEADVFREKNSPPPDVQLIRREMNDCIRGLIESLPPDYRTVLLLSELEGFKNSEISEILVISLETVKIRLHRARARLKKALEDNCSFYRDERNEFACDRKAPTLKFRKK